MFESILEWTKSMFDWSKSSNEIHYVNYKCPECMKDGKAIPNAGGRFFIINESQCACNGCGGVFPKSDYFMDAGVDQQNA